MAIRLLVGAALAAVSLAAVLTAGAATAETPLTCDAFSARLDAAITEMGGLVALPGPMRLGYDNGETGKRLAWGRSPGLTGTLTCSASDAFEDFTIVIPETVRTSDDLPRSLGQLSEMASASVCALAAAAPEACRTLTRTMVQGSLEQFRTSLGKGEEVPTGSRDYRIVDGVDAELDLTPLAITWSIGPGRAAITATSRSGLAPKNLDD